MRLVTLSASAIFSGVTPSGGLPNKIEFSFGVYKQLNDAFKKAKKS